MTQQHALNLTSLTRSFGAKRAVDDVDLHVVRHEILGFLGSNGAGKTTLMKLIMGLLKPDSGEIQLLGVSGGARSKETRLRVGYLQEKPSVYPEMTARDYLKLFAELYGLADPVNRVADVLQRVGLAHASDRPLGAFSRGMQQRACLARVMLHEPEFLLLDEPTLGLDPTGVADIREILLEMRENGTTLMFSSHQLAEMERICDRVAFMKDGRIVATGTPSEILTEHRDGVVRAETAEPIAPHLDHIGQLSGIQTVRATGPHTVELVASTGGIQRTREARAAISQALTERGLTVLSVVIAKPSLEDIFLSLDRSETPKH
jgi:ABC-2 type transport system ATP-binding protein